ncbi:MAG TPA: bifunctional adenosylcobinamide kinase/adenosylcobinamide-phosphate guanylyltransferase [Verrucomicrobiae bacterium]|nr:bifunctional adenosylcobinamide kinase/adenosylcobinamide-phosphate guanylyltransferase [Verrucomicrobiae bacterium]
MSRTVLITGGARSGKSRIAEDLAEACGPPLGYIATAAPGDAEMAQRIARHRDRRGDRWRTFEEQYDLAGTIVAAGPACGALLVDCITLWLSNLLLRGDTPDVDDVLREVRGLASLLPRLQTPLFLVTSEVGMGIVPDNRLARLFGDLAGEANQILAAAADEVYLAVSGIPLKIKG